MKARCAGVELLGQDIQQSLAIKLSHVYVPALTPREAAAVAPDEPTRRSRMEPEEQRWCRCCSGSTRARCTSPPRPAPANPPSAAGRSCRAFRRRDLPSGPGAGGVPGTGAEALRTRLPLLVPLRDFWTAHARAAAGNAPGTGAIWSRRSPPGSTGLAAAGPERRSAQGSPRGGQRLPVAGRPGRGARLRTRNGATVYPRELLLSGLADALPAWEEAGNRTLLTSRPYGLDEAGLARLGLPRAPLEPLPKPLQELFVARWFHTLKPGKAGRRAARGDARP